MAQHSSLPEKFADTRSSLVLHGPVPLRSQDSNAERAYCDHVFRLLREKPELMSKKNNYSELHAILQKTHVHPPYGSAQAAKSSGLKCGWEILSQDSRFVVERECSPSQNNSNSFLLRISLACEEAAAALSAQTTLLQDKIKELELDKEFITASLAQAKTDIEMQTKAR